MDDSAKRDIKMNVFARTLNWFFGCHHDSMSRVFTIKMRSYRVCYHCGHEFNYSLETMQIAAQPMPLRTLGGKGLLAALSPEVATVETRTSKLGRARA